MTRRGVALVLVLWIVVILGALAAGVTGASRASIGLAANVRAGTVARYAAESGLAATVAEIEGRLAGGTDSVARATYLNALAITPRDSVTLGGGRFVVAVVDPSTRLDVNAAPEDRLAGLLSTFTDIGRATETARYIRRAIEQPPAAAGDGRLTSTDGGSLRFVTPIRSLDALRAIPGVDQRALERAAAYLTVDGDGTVNRRMASDTVLRVAFGEQRDEPSRLVLVARGWSAGSPLTHEIQGVYAVSGPSLVLVQWRERQR